MGLHSGSDRPHPGDGEGRIRTLRELRDRLAGKSEFDALVLLAEGDPLGVEDAAYAALRARHLILSPERIQRRALTWLATWAAHPIEIDSLAALIERAVAVAVEELLDEEARASRANPVLEEPLEPRHALLARRLGLAPNQVRHASQALNDLPAAEREAIHCILVQGEGFTRFAERKGLDARVAKDLVTRALLALRKRIDEIGEEGSHDA